MKSGPSHGIQSSKLYRSSLSTMLEITFDKIENRKSFIHKLLYSENTQQDIPQELNSAFADDHFPNVAAIILIDDDEVINKSLSYLKEHFGFDFVSNTKQVSLSSLDSSSDSDEYSSSGSDESSSYVSYTPRYADLAVSIPTETQCPQEALQPLRKSKSFS